MPSDAEFERSLKRKAAPCDVRGVAVWCGNLSPYLYITSVWNPSMLPVSPWPWIELNFTSKIS